MKKYFRDRYWFGWWFATICSAHYYIDSKCPTCKYGNWTRVNHVKLFGKL